MPKPICCECSLEMRIYHTGAKVVELYGDPEKPSPYKIWNGDEYQCPKCKDRVVVHFGNNPRNHFDTGFAKQIAYLKAQDETPVYWVPEKYIPE